jgi:hypothetical protein
MNWKDLLWLFGVMGIGFVVGLVVGIVMLAMIGK